MFRKHSSAIPLMLLVSVLLPNAAAAGLNSAAVAHLYWQSGSTGSALAARDNTNGTCQLVVTCTGLVNFRGADVQIQLGCLDGTGVPEAWQGQVGGCAEGYVSGFVGGRGGTTFQSAFASAPALDGTVTSQNEELFNSGDCKTPHQTALLWLSAAGATGVARNPSSEYAVWAIAFDLTSSVELDGSTACAGGSADPAGPKPMCLVPNLRVPCDLASRPGALKLLDGDLSEDFIEFSMASNTLTWSGGLLMSHCSLPPPAVPRTTWGAIKKAYR